MINLGVMPPAQAKGWETLVELHRKIGTGWTIVGGQMVYAHCVSRGYDGIRPTTDADTVLDVRARGRILYEFTTVLKELGFSPEANNVAGHQSHWRFDEVRVDVMIPTSLGSRASQRTGVSGGTALETPGAQKAINRSRLVEVRWEGTDGGKVPLPSMLGALVAKSRAFQIDRLPGRERHLEDLLALTTVALPSDRLNDADSKERKILASGLANVAAFARERNDEVGLDAIAAVKMMARLKGITR